MSVSSALAERSWTELPAAAGGGGVRGHSEGSWSSSSGPTPRKKGHSVPADQVMLRVLMCLKCGASPRGDECWVCDCVLDGTVPSGSECLTQCLKWGPSARVDECWVCDCVSDGTVPSGSKRPT